MTNQLTVFGQYHFPLQVSLIQQKITFYKYIYYNTYLHVPTCLLTCLLSKILV